MAYKGKFKPKNPSKYIGDPTNIVYRSLWERRFMIYCDNEDNILSWGSEEVVIPYVSPIDNKVHRYYRGQTEERNQKSQVDRSQTDETVFTTKEANQSHQEVYHRSQNLGCELSKVESRKRVC